MSLSIRSFMSLVVAAVALAFLAAPVHAQDEAKVAKIVAKTLVKYDKTVLSYDKKIDRLAAKCAVKVGKMVAKGQSAELINAYIAKSITTGMNHANVTRAKIDTTETNGLRGLVKYGSPAEATSAISADADASIQEVNDRWDEAAVALHALEVPE